MKNLKKVLAMVLAFACTFSMFAGAKVFEDVPAGSDYSEAITMLSDLGVIQGKDDGKYHPEDTITRVEACAMIARLMTGDPKASQYVGAQSFSDVQKGSWKDSAIGYCYINGIVIGVGNNKFEPDRAITDAEFVTMVVRAMGYETADMKQNYPFSYMSNAQAVGLLDGTNMVASTDALRGEDAQVIYNALFADYARGAKLVNTTHGTSVESYPTLAESVWGLQRAAVGTWDKDNKDDEKATLTNCKAHTWVVVGADKKNEGNILAYPIKDDETDVYASEKNKYVPYSFKYAGDASAIAGYQVELWGEGKHGEPTWEKGEGKFVYSDNWEIKAIKTVKGQKAYDYNASMADSKDDNGEIKLDETTLKLESVADNAKELSKENTTKTNLTTYLSKDEYNGEKIGDKKNVEKALNVRTGAQYKLVDWDSDGDIDWVVVDQASYFKVESVNSKRLTVSAMKADSKLQSKAEDESKTWKLDDLNDEKDYKVKYEVPKDLEEGDVIELTYKVAYDKGEKCEVITATATKVEADNAELDKVSTKDDLELTFSGEVSKIAQNAAFGDIIDPANPDKYADFDDEELGTEFALWKNRNGFIVYSDYATESSNYMMVLDTGDGSDKPGDRKLAKADILLADNSVKKDVEFASDLKIDGKNNNTTGYDKDSREWKEELVVGNVYKYWADEDGKITKMEAAIDVKDAAKDDNYTYDESSDRLKADDSFVASLEGADVIFAVTKNYIEGTGDLSVDDENVLAVKKNDIPDIALGSNDTKTAQLAANNLTWLGNEHQNHFIANVDKNGEASAAILGVENFNKFNDAATTVGLVTSVSYDKNDVVEIEVAYKGEVTTVKSAEKVDFDDIVEAYDQSAKKDLSLSSPKDTVNNALFNNEKLSDFLKKNGAYAEITTDADGKLTAVTFMDKAEDNKVVGHYYEVSRRIITDVKDGNVAYGNAASYYYNDKNLYSVDRLPVTDTDLDKDVKYYSINGRPEINGKDSDDYKGVLLSVVNGFDGTPDIKAESDSVLVESFVNDKFDDADTYEIADLARKIDGDIVAAFAFEDSLGETDKKADSVVVDVDKNAAKAVPNDGEDHDIADVKSAQGGGNVTADVKVYKDGKEVSDVTAKLDSKDLKVNAQKGAATGDYVAKFTVDKTTYEVKFSVVAADVTEVAASAEVVAKGVSENAGSTKASYDAQVTTPANTTDAFTVRLTYTMQDGQEKVVSVDAKSADTSDAEKTAQAIVDAINGQIDLKGLFTASVETTDHVKVEAKDGKTVKSVDNLEVGGKTVLGSASKATSDYVAAVTGVAKITIKGGINVTGTQTYKLSVDGSAQTETVEVTSAMDATAIANAVTAAYKGNGTYTVTNDGAVITVTQKSAATANMELKLEKQA